MAHEGHDHIQLRTQPHIGHEIKFGRTRLCLTSKFNGTLEIG